MIFATNAKKRLARIFPILLVLAGLGATLLYVSRIPFNMDEFVPYRPLACSPSFFPFNSLNDTPFRLPCSSLLLTLPGTSLPLPLLSYPYIGSLRSFFYLPLYLFWSNPLSHRLLGFVFLVIQAYLLKKIARRISYAESFLFLLFFFPYAYLLFMDTTSIEWHTTSIFLSFLLMRGWFASARHPKNYSPPEGESEDKKTPKKPFPSLPMIALALTLFLGVWAKLVYFWILPSVGILFLFFSYTYRFSILRHKKQFLSSAAVGILLFSFLTAIFLFSSSLSGERLYQQITGAPIRSPIETIVNFPKSVVAFWLFNPFEAMQKSFSVPNILPLYLLIPASVYAVVLFFVGIPILWYAKHRRHIRRSLTHAPSLLPIILLALFWVSLVIASASKQIGHLHHIIIFFPFLILGFFLLLNSFSAKIRWAILLPFIALNLFFYLNTWSFPIRTYDDWSKVKVLHRLSDPILARNYLYITVDWGMYTIQSLYGPPEQAVLYLEPFTEKEHVALIEDMKRATGRKALFIAMPDPSFVAIDPQEESDFSFITSSFTLVPCAFLPSDAPWAVFLEPSSEMGFCAPDPELPPGTNNKQ